MLRGLIISPDQLMGQELEQHLTQLRMVRVERSLSKYPDLQELGRTIRAHSPEVIFIDIQSMRDAVSIATMAESALPGVQQVAITRKVNPQDLIELMRVGVREFLACPFGEKELYDAYARIKDALAKRPIQSTESEFVYSFLPAKPGVGASTIAMNVAHSCSALGNCKALLADLDLNSGMQRFMLKLDNDYCLTDATENAEKMDVQLWTQLVSSLGDLDILHSGRLNPGYRIEPGQLTALMNFIRRMYKVVCLDLSGNMEKYSLEAMQESRRVFLVTTPEIASLHLARERFHYLKSVELSDRVNLLVNRGQKRSTISNEQIEDLLGIRVLATFPNDYQGVSRALTLGKAVDAGSELGQQFHQLALAAVDRDPSEGPNKGSAKRFSDYFNLFPSKMGFLQGRKSPAN